MMSATGRRWVVFGVILVAGLLIGIFCLPDSGPESAAPPPPTENNTARLRDSLGSLPELDTSQTKPEQLVKKAMLTTDAVERGKYLQDAYNLDKTGRWGGEAAAEIGFLWKAANDPEKAKLWFLAAKRNPISAETVKRIDAELDPPARRSDAPGPTPTAPLNVITYKVQQNDSLWKIGKQFAVTADLIREVNKLPSDNLKVNAVLKVPKGPFDVLVSKRNHTLQILQDGKVIKTYSVCLGENGSTPTGDFTVQNKLVNPTWHSPGGGIIPPGDPRNLLGSRWIGFKEQFGIHGTRKQDEDTIGKDMSNGCVRLLDAHVKEVYSYVVEGKSKVKIVD